MKKRDTDLEIQEQIVSILWDFARAQQTMPHNAQNKQGTTVNRQAVGEALKKILALFGLSVRPIE